MTDNSKYYEKTREILREVIGCNLKSVTLQARLIEDLGLDSLDAVEVIMGFEQEFDILVPDAEALERRTVEDVLRLLHTVLGVPYEDGCAPTNATES